MSRIREQLWFLWIERIKSILALIANVGRRLDIHGTDLSQDGTARG